MGDAVHISSLLVKDITETVNQKSGRFTLEDEFIVLKKRNVLVFWLYTGPCGTQQCCLANSLDYFL